MTLSNFLDRLEARGLVRRMPDPNDRRAKLVTITPTARPLMERIQMLAAGVRLHAIEGLSPGEVETFGRVLQAMRRNLSDAAERGSA
jgi:DNA-binding MarR family transcriptional regulator